MMREAPDHPLLEGLNPAQRDAVATTDGPVLIVAGPGSGKTRVITHRVAYLMDQGVAPWEICALTFTNKAAREMRERVEQLRPDRRGFWISTFHSTCARILRREIGALGYEKAFTIYDERDRTRALEQSLDTLGMDRKRHRPRDFIWAISDAKNRLVDAKAMAEEANSYEERQVATVYAAYEKLLRKHNALDFDDLLFKMVELLYRHPTVLAEYQTRLRYLLVDEYQDTNLAQYEIVSRIAAEHRNLAVCGDPDQSIYSWRGADAANLRHFREDFPEHRLILLDTNYRSTRSILAAADALISHNPDRLIDKLDTPNPTGEPVRTLRYDTDRDEARAVAGAIKAQIDSGMRASSFAVFYRINAMSRQLEQALTRARIEYVVVGSTGFYERREVKDALGYLTLIANPADELALARVTNVPPRGVGQTTLGRLRRHAEAQGITLMAAVHDVDRIPEIKGRPKGGVRALAGLLEAIEETAGATSSVADLLEMILEKSGYRDRLATSPDPTEVERLENLDELLRAAREYDMDSGSPSPGGFLEEVALFRAIEEGGDVDRVQLMSLHAAKGLEFPVVFVTGVENGLIPHQRAWDDPDQMEEERRLMYVGITRAKQRLYLSHVRWRNRYNGQATAQAPSDFLSEIADPYHVPGSSDDLPPDPALEAALAGESPIENEPDLPPPFDVGQRVRSAYFGVGTVLEISGSGKRAKARVRFADKVRTLVLEHAHLVASAS